MTNPINGVASYVATRPTVGSRPVATVDFVLPATAGNVTNVNVNVSTVEAMAPRCGATR